MLHEIARLECHYLYFSLFNQIRKKSIYINENIAGLIKYLGAKLIVDPEKKRAFLQKLESEIKQPDNLNFLDQQKKARMWMITNPATTKDHISNFFNI